MTAPTGKKKPDNLNNSPTWLSNKNQTPPNRAVFLRPDGGEMSKIPRIAGDEWMAQRAAVATAVYNADYGFGMERIKWQERPWSVMGPGGFRTFDTHAEAIEWAFNQPTPPDLGPQEQSSVTTGWAPAPDKEAAWQEKWNLTR